MSSPRRALLLIAAAGAAFALAACDIGDDGPRTTHPRDVAAFTRIDNQDSVDIRLDVGEPQRIRVHAGEKVIDDVRTDVRDGTLHITFDHDGFGGADVVVEASVPRLTAIEADGSGDIDADGIDAGTFELRSDGSGDINADGFDAETFELRSDGSGDIELEGTTEQLAMELDGSGDVDLAALKAREARVAVSGSGDTDVRAADRLEVDVDGSGDVRYHGDPELDQRVDGSGELSRAN